MNRYEVTAEINGERRHILVDASHDYVARTLAGIVVGDSAIVRVIQTENCADEDWNVAIREHYSQRLLGDSEESTILARRLGVEMSVWHGDKGGLSVMLQSPEGMCLGLDLVHYAEFDTIQDFNGSFVDHDELWDAVRATLECGLAECGELDCPICNPDNEWTGFDAK